MPSSEDFLISDSLYKHNSSYIYGEIDIQSMKEILDTMFPNSSEQESYRFIDIGSGCGNLCATIDSHYGFYVCGIEIDENRFQKSLKYESDKLEFVWDSFENLYFGNYDILYCCNIVFSIEDNIILYEKIKREFKGICFLFDYNQLLLPYFEKTFSIKTSWCKSANLHMFII